MIDDKRLARIESDNIEFRGVTCEDVGLLIAEVWRLRRVLERLGSAEAFTIPMEIGGNDPREAEIRARMDYARKALS